MIETPPEFLVGLDLGQSQDYTAIAILKRTVPPTESHWDSPPASYAVVHLERMRGKPYPEIVRHVCALLASPELQPPPPPPPKPTMTFHRIATFHTGRGWEAVSDPYDPGGYEPPPPSPKKPSLVIDSTGVGKPVVELFAAAKPPAELQAITITSGESDNDRRESWCQGRVRARWVPKKLLVSTVQVLLQTGRLKIVPGLDLAETLRRELMDFQVRITKSANETFNAREGTHDDLVLAVALPLWVGEDPKQYCRFFPLL